MLANSDRGFAMKIVPIDRDPSYEPPGSPAGGRGTEDVLPQEFSEDSLALRFAERHADSLRYVAS
jgi:hypothetical protein